MYGGKCSRDEIVVDERTGNPVVCDKVDLYEDNNTAWRLWTLLDQFDRPVSEYGIASIPTKAVRSMCAQYGSGINFEKILIIEGTILPLRRVKLRKEMEARKEQNKQNVRSRKRTRK